MFDKKILNSAVYFFDGNFLVSLYEYGVVYLLLRMNQGVYLLWKFLKMQRHLQNKLGYIVHYLTCQAF